MCVCACCYCSLTSWFVFFLLQPFDVFYDCFGRFKRDEWVWLSSSLSIFIVALQTVHEMERCCWCRNRTSLKVYAMHNCRAHIAYVLLILFSLFVCLYHFITYFTLVRAHLSLGARFICIWVFLENFWKKKSSQTINSSKSDNNNGTGNIELFPCK